MGKHKISHMKQHESALEDVPTRELRDQLVSDWPSLTIIQRGDRLQPLLAAGCTEGGMARDLSCDKGTIRRAVNGAALSPKDRLMVERGANPGSVLRRQHHWAELVDDVCRLLRESLDGSVSHELALNIVWYLCSYFAEVCFHYDMRQEFFDAMDFSVRAKAGWIRSNWIRARWWAPPPSEINQRNRGLLLLAKDCAPQPEESNDSCCYFDHVQFGLTKFIGKLENRPSLIVRALDKAFMICRQFDRNRASDFEIVTRGKTLTPEAFAQAMKEHLRVKNSVHSKPRRLVA